MSGRSNPDKEMTFWDHLEEFRWVLVRSLIAIIGFATVAFCMKEPIFNFIFAPKDSNFIVYRGLNHLAELLHMPSMRPPVFSVQLINIELASQFFVHMRVAFMAGVLIAFPYIIYEFWKFIKPALYDNEKKSAGPILFYCCALFYAGIAIGYYMVFPLTVQFLGTYQVSALVPNQISLNSYMDIFIILLVMMGAVFEMPILAYFLAVIGFLSADFLKKNRKIAFVIIMAVAALVTPTGDAFTLSVVTLPMYLLYELSIAVVKKAEKKHKNEPTDSDDPEDTHKPDKEGPSNPQNSNNTTSTKEIKTRREEPEDFYNEKDMYGLMDDEEE